MGIDFYAYLDTIKDNPCIKDSEIERTIKFEKLLPPVDCVVPKSKSKASLFKFDAEMKEIPARKIVVAHKYTLKGFGGYEKSKLVDYVINWKGRHMEHHIKPLDHKKALPILCRRGWDKESLYQLLNDGWLVGESTSEIERDIDDMLKDWKDKEASMDPPSNYNNLFDMYQDLLKG